MIKAKQIGILFCLSALLFSCSPAKEKVDNDLIPYSITRVFVHDTSAFTQGLVVERGRLFESTGQYGTSWIAEIDISNGQSDKKVILEKKYFGEGITILNNKIYQLTWKSKIGFIYDLNTFKKIGEFEYDREGWGITHDGKNLIVSDGTDQLYFLDSITLKPITVLKVRDGDRPAQQLNELEFIKGFVYANQWQTNYILKIDPHTGEVTGRLDMTEVAEKVFPLNPKADVLNGIAYEKKSETLLITGKLWPALVAVRFKESVKK